MRMWKMRRRNKGGFWPNRPMMKMRMKTGTGGGDDKEEEVAQTSERQLIPMENLKNFEYLVETSIR